jgi:hypothetical protein
MLHTPLANHHQWLESGHATDVLLAMSIVLARAWQTKDLSVLYRSDFGLRIGNLKVLVLILIINMELPTIWVNGLVYAIEI